ncbi:MAG: nucleoside triphosphate pyrophosphohydrolase [Deltaproteobacteria bacterium]|nr:nucleoside triphosphate pyrophosphohydrolase [Deltaproteobacteria bacterium]
MSQSFDELVAIMARLRGPGGCPWDHEQTHESIVPQLIEETYEAIGAIDAKNWPHLCEEVGDLLLHLLFHSQIASETKDFTINDVVTGLTAKLVRRHPHVFGDTKVKDAGEVIKNWDKIKAGEKKNQKMESALDNIPRALPALMQAYKLTKKASKMGFDWEKTEDVLKKVDEEIREIKEAVKTKNQEEIAGEIGDLFFSLANLCRFLQVPPEEALRTSNEKFRKRFGTMEKTIREQGKKMEEMNLSELDSVWNQIKKSNSPL